MHRAGETIEERTLDKQHTVNDITEHVNDKCITKYIPKTGSRKVKYGDTPLNLGRVKREKISLTITEELNKTNIYPDCRIDSKTWKYFEDLDKQNKDRIQIGAHLHWRQKSGTPYTFIGIVKEKLFGGTSNLTNKNGEMIECDYYILKIYSTKKSLGLGLPPNTIVPKIEEEHSLFIRFKNDGSPRKGGMRYQYDSCCNSGITRLHTAPQRGILY